MSNPVQHKATTDADPIRLHGHSQNNNDHDEREATELGQLVDAVNLQNASSNTPATLNSAAETSSIPAHQKRSDGLRRWWKHYIQLHVPHAACRDHLGMFFFQRFASSIRKPRLQRRHATHPEPTVRVCSSQVSHTARMHWTRN